MQKNYDILVASVLQNIDDAKKLTVPEYNAIAHKDPKTIYILFDDDRETVLAHAIGDIQIPKMTEATLGETSLGSSILTLTSN